MAYYSNLIEVRDTAEYFGIWASGGNVHLASWDAEGAFVRQVGSSLGYGGAIAAPWRSWWHPGESLAIIWLSGAGGPLFPLPGSRFLGVADFGASSVNTLAATGTWTRSHPYSLVDGIVYLEADGTATGNSRALKAGFDLSSPTVVSTGVDISVSTDFAGAAFYEVFADGFNNGVVHMQDAGSQPSYNATLNLDVAGNTVLEPHPSQDQEGYAYPVPGQDRGVGINAAGNVAVWRPGLAASDGFTERAPAFNTSNVHLDKGGDMLLAYKGSTGALKVNRADSTANNWSRETTLASVPAAVDAGWLKPPSFAFWVR